MDFSKINANKSGMGALLGALNKTSFVKSDYSKDDEWNLSRDKAGNGSAVIRFIPSKDGELFMEVKNHGYKNKESGRWFIENCPKTLDWEAGCPACEHANALKKGREWKNIAEAEQKQISPFFPKTSYWANILVVKDPEAPENEGKVFKFRFGKKILEKIMNRAADDELTSQKGINVFDFEHGANFKLACKKVSGWPNYDDSVWLTPSPLENADKVIESGHDIGWMRTDKNFKEYSELKKKFYGVLNTAIPDTQSAEDIDESIPDSAEDKYDESIDESMVDDTGDADLDYFQNLSEQDI